MSIKTKLIVAAVVSLIVLLVLPLISLQIVDPVNGMVMLIVLFLMVNSFTSIGLGVMVGKDIRKLWWIPLAFSAAFLPCYWLALEMVVIDLFVYALFYLGLGLLSMFVSYWLFPRKEDNQYYR